MGDEVSGPQWRLYPTETPPPHTTNHELWLSKLNSTEHLYSVVIIRKVIHLVNCLREPFVIHYPEHRISQNTIFSLVIVRIARQECKQAGSVLDDIPRSRHNTEDRDENRSFSKKLMYCRRQQASTCILLVLVQSRRCRMGMNLRRSDVASMNEQPNDNIVTCE